MGSEMCIRDRYIFACTDWFVLVFLPVCLLQGARALSTFGGGFTDPELSHLASSLPLQCLGAQADSTVERYSRAFENFRLWAAGYREISVLPTSFLHVATYLEFLVQSNLLYHLRLNFTPTSPFLSYGFKPPSQNTFTLSQISVKENANKGM